MWCVGGWCHGGSGVYHVECHSIESWAVLLFTAQTAGQSLCAHSAFGADSSAGLRSHECYLINYWAFSFSIFSVFDLSGIKTNFTPENGLYEQVIIYNDF